MPQRLPTFPVFDNFHVDVIATASATSKSPTNAFAGGNRWQRAITWSTDEALAVLEGNRDHAVVLLQWASGPADVSANSSPKHAPKETATERYR